MLFKGWYRDNQTEEEEVGKRIMKNQEAWFNWKNFSYGNRYGHQEGVWIYKI